MSASDKVNPLSRTEAMARLVEYQNLQAMMQGCVSGQHTEWPLLREELCRLLATHDADVIAECKIVAEVARKASASADRSLKAKLPSLPEEIQEWCWHMDTHLTEHDIRHAGLALRAAWPHVSKWLQENVGPSSKSGVPFNAAASSERATQTWCPHVGGLGPPFPLCGICDTVRYCAGCGSVGDVPNTFRDCCPDGGSMSCYIPRKIAEQCHGTFTAAIAEITKVAPNSATSPSICYYPCDKHMGVPWTIKVGVAASPRQVCPICHPPEGGGA